jgi:hemolysin III
MVLSLRGPWGWTILVIIWVLALLGILYQMFFLGRYRKLSAAGYVAMGWVVVVAARQVWLMIPHGALAWVAAGGALYTFGMLFYGWKRLPYHHAIWHLFVIAGSTCHYFAILLYLVPRP